MPSSINGIGTMYYGRALPRPDGSIVRTVWITVFYIPLIPLGSHRVWFQGRDSKWYSNRTVVHYKAAKAPFHFPHLIQGWAATACIIAFFMWVDHTQK